MLSFRWHPYAIDPNGNYENEERTLVTFTLGQRLWELDPVRLEEAKRTLEVIGRQWELALGKLKAFAEAT